MKIDRTRTGTGKAVIQIPKQLFPIEKFSGIHDDINARALILESGQKAVIISLELTSLPSYEIEVLKEKVMFETGIQKENIWICVTHTFSAPHVRSQDAVDRDVGIAYSNSLLCRAIEDAVSVAVRIAAARMSEVKIGFGCGHCAVNTNRDVFTDTGWWLGSNDSGISDKSVPVIRFDTLDDEPFALLYSYDVQSSIMDGAFQSDGYRLTSGDLAGMASRYIEEQYDRPLVAMFCMGAAGDQAPAMKAEKVDGFALVEALSTTLGNAVLRTAGKIKCIQSGDGLMMKKYKCQCPGQQMPKSRSDIHPTKRYDFIQTGEKEIEIEIIKLGDIALIGIQPEICSITAMEIKKSSPMTQTMIFTMVNGGAKYMADISSYDRITYGAMNSPFGRGAAEIFATKVLGYLEELYGYDDEGGEL